MQFLIYFTRRQRLPGVYPHGKLRNRPSHINTDISRRELSASIQVSKTTDHLQVSSMWSVCPPPLNNPLVFSGALNRSLAHGFAGRVQYRDFRSRVQLFATHARELAGCRFLAASPEQCHAAAQLDRREQITVEEEHAPEVGCDSAHDSCRHWRYCRPTALPYGADGVECVCVDCFKYRIGVLGRTVSFRRRMSCLL